MEPRRWRWGTAEPGTEGSPNPGTRLVRPRPRRGRGDWAGPKGEIQGTAFSLAWTWYSTGMSLTTGTVTVNNDGTYTGTGLAVALYEAQLADYNAQPTVPSKASLLTVKRSLADFSNTLASALAPYINANVSESVLNVLSPSTWSGDQNNYNPTNFSAQTNVLRLSSGTFAQNLTGIQAPSSGSQRLILSNIGANAITLVNSSVSSSLANRFILSANVVLASNQCVEVWYDAASQGWRSVI